MHGLDLASLIGLLVVSLVCIAVAWGRYEQRDIRVSGEGGWRLPFSLPGRRAVSQ
jgi:hypothetical protein